MLSTDILRFTSFPISLKQHRQYGFYLKIKKALEKYQHFSVLLIIPLNVFFSSMSLLYINRNSEINGITFNNRSRQLKFVKMVEHFEKEYWILNKQQEYKKESNVNEYDVQCIYQWPQFHRIIDQWHFPFCTDIDI